MLKQEPGPGLPGEGRSLACQRSRPFGSTGPGWASRQLMLGPRTGHPAQGSSDATSGEHAWPVQGCSENGHAPLHLVQAAHGGSPVLHPCSRHAGIVHEGTSHLEVRDATAGETSALPRTESGRGLDDEPAAELQTKVGAAASS